MKSLKEAREAAGKTGGTLIEGAQKTAYAMVGVPVLAGRKLADYRSRMVDGARKEFDTLAEEGEQFTKHLRERKLMAEIKEKVDLDQIQDRVTKIKDQLEDVLSGWRESFRPSDKAVEAPKPAPKASARKATPKKTAPKSG